MLYRNTFEYILINIKDFEVLCNMMLINKKYSKTIEKLNLLTLAFDVKSKKMKNYN